MIMKRLILVTSPPACGKTYVSKELAKALHPIVYMDKDTLIVLSKQIFVVAGEEYNRSSPFLRRTSAITNMRPLWIWPWSPWTMRTCA